jgi:hypothetical protein
MNRRKWLLSAAAAAAVAGPDVVHADNNGDGIVGSWFGTVTATEPPLGSFNSLISFHTGEIVVESRRYLVKGTPFGDLLETTGHGAWKRSGNRQYDVFFRFLIQNHDTGEPIGTDNIRLQLRLSRDRDALDGTFQSQIRLTDDTVVFEAAGTYTASRITV